MKKRVVITGIGVLSPIGLDKETFLAGLRKGVSGVRKIESFDASQFPTSIAAEIRDFVPENYMERKKVRRSDRFTQFAIAAAKIAIEDSGLLSVNIDKRKVGVIIGSGIGGISTIEKEHKVLLEKGPRRCNPFMIPKEIIDMAAGEIAMEYKFTGLNYGVVSACASANHAIGNALRHLRYGDADVIIAGGAEAAITPLSLAGFCAAGALSKRNDEPQKACRPFDKKRDGFVMGEGAGILVLETLEHAMKRSCKIYAELCGYGTTDDAYHITAPEPSAEPAAEAMRGALLDAGISPEEVEYVNAHGTSTPLNDKTETIALKKIFGERAYKIPISSTKSMIGHLLGAAGAVELIATIFCMEAGFVHPTINYEFPDPECDLDYIPNKPREISFRTAISNSFGFGGHNAVLVVKKYENR